MSLRPLEGRVFFTAREIHEGPEENPRLGLALTSENEFPCCNYSIVADVSYDGITVSVDLLGVRVPGVCLTAMGPARLRIPLNLGPGLHMLKITRDGATDSYNLRVTEASVRVEETWGQRDEQGNSFTVPETNIFWRYPPRSFVITGHPGESGTAVLDSFVAVLRSQMELVEFAMPDTGTCPYPVGADQPARFFRYPGETDYDWAGTLLEYYAQDVLCPNQLPSSLSMTNWRNIRHGSWVRCD